MSISQVYYLAHRARAKLASEASQADHNLRLLVGHANLLDSLMVDLADAEREQESWFNQSVRTATPKSGERHVQWADTIPEQAEEEWEADSSDSDSDSDSDDSEDEDVEMADVVSVRRIQPSSIAPPSPQLESMDEDIFEDDDEEDYASLTLTRSSSHSASPPELEHDSDTSEDEAMPPSPPFESLPSFSKKQRDTQHKHFDSIQDDDQKTAFYDEGFYLPPRNPARLVSAISVY